MTIAARLGLVLAMTAVGALLPGASLAEDRVVRVWHTETEPQTIQAVNDIARRFEGLNPGVSIAVRSVGSGKGIAELRGRASDIAMLSRQLVDNERDLFSYPLCRDGAAIVERAERQIEVVEALVDQLDRAHRGAGEPG